MTSIYTTEQLKSTPVPQLHKIVKGFGIKYKEYCKMKKADAISFIIGAQEKPCEVKPDAKSFSHSEIEQQTKEFLSRGGKIIEGPSPQDPKTQVPTPRSALKVGSKLKKYKPSGSLFDDIDTNPETEIKEKPVKRKKTPARKVRTEEGIRPTPKSKKTKKAAPVSDRQDPNSVTLQSLTEKLSIDPYEARKALRASDIEKPGKQWVWAKGHKDIKKIEKLLKGIK